MCYLIKRGKSPIYGNSNLQIIKSGQARGYTNFDFESKYFAAEDFIADDRMLQTGDILINSTGVGTAGRVTLFELVGNFTVDSHITICRPNKEIIPRFMLYSLASIGFTAIEKMANGASGQIELSLSTISNISIPVPPLTVQKKLVEKAEEYEKKIEKLQVVMNSISQKKETILENYLN